MRPALIAAAAALAAILLAGCDPPPPRFVEVAVPGDTRDPIGPYTVTAVTRGATDDVDVFWNVPGAAEPSRVDLDYDGRGRWSGGIPGARPGTQIELYVVAAGGGGDARWPSSGVRQFRVLDPDARCIVDGDCLSGEICDRDEGRCQVQPEVCQDDGDCPQDYICPGPGERCRFRPSTCDTAEQCGAGFDCMDGICVRLAECTDDLECPAGEICLNPPGECIPDAVTGCEGGCPDGTVCEDDACVPVDPCDRCPAGRECIDGRCLPPDDCDCPAGTFCDTDEACVECTADGHCGADAHCDVEARTCVPSARRRICGPCGPGGECGGALTCADIGIDFCTRSCERGERCPRGFFCDGSVCVPEDFCAGFDCDRDGDCESGVCTAGVCEPLQRCTEDADCAADRRCEAGRCVFRGAPCESGFDCPRGDVCVAGHCAPSATEAVCGDCEPGAGECGPQGYCADTGGRFQCVTLCGEGTCGEGFFCEPVWRGASACFDDRTGQPFCDAGGGDTCEADWVEPNNGFREAAPVGNGDRFDELTACEGDDDWYRFVSQRRPTTLQIATDRPLEITGYDEGARVTSGLVVEPGETNLGIGDRSVVFQVRAIAGDARYSFLLIGPDDPPPECEDDVLEDNDSLDNPTRLGNGAEIFGTACPGDSDVFFLRLDEEEAGEVFISAPPVGLQYRLVLGGGAVIDEGEVGEETFLPVFFEPDGLYLVLLCEGCESPYILNTFFEDGGGGGGACEPDGFEPNDRQEDATPLRVPSEVDATLCGRDQDYYTFARPQRRGEVVVRFDHDDGDLDMRLTDDQGRVVGESLSTDDVERIPIPNRGVGRVLFLHVYSASGPATNTYTLELQQ